MCNGTLDETSLSHRCLSGTVEVVTFPFAVLLLTHTQSKSVNEGLVVNRSDVKRSQRPFSRRDTQPVIILRMCKLLDRLRLLYPCTNCKVVCDHCMQRGRAGVSTLPTQCSTTAMNTNDSRLQHTLSRICPINRQLRRMYMYELQHSLRPFYACTNSNIVCATHVQTVT